MDELILGERPLTIGDITDVARRGRTVGLGPEARRRLAAARAVVERILAEDRVVYGVTTGFGLLATTRIPLDQVRKLQLNLIRSHAVGVGDALPRDVVRAAMLLRTSTIAKEIGRASCRERV